MAGVSRVYKAICTPSHGPGRYICPFKGGQYMENGSDISYRSWVDARPARIFCVGVVSQGCVFLSQ